MGINLALRQRYNIYITEKKNVLIWHKKCVKSDFSSFDTTTCMCGSPVKNRRLFHRNMQWTNLRFLHGTATCQIVRCVKSTHVLTGQCAKLLVCYSASVLNNKCVILWICQNWRHHFRHTFCGKLAHLFFLCIVIMVVNLMCNITCWMGFLAQKVEHQRIKLKVVGSSPTEVHFFLLP